MEKADRVLSKNHDNHILMKDRIASLNNGLFVN